MRTLCFILFCLVPILQAQAQSWLKVACGGEFSLGLRSDGTLWAWGYNANGQLGIGSSEQQAAPQQIGSETDWADVVAGGYHSLALKKDGSLWAWGFNAAGQLGDGSTSDRNVPVQVGTENDWSVIAAGMVTSYAIKKDHSLWGWGFNQNGVLGNGNTINQEAPSRIGADNDWESVSAGGLHALAVKSDHSLWGWGSDQNGQAGLGAAGIVRAPQQVGTGSFWKAVECGFEFSLAQRDDGTIWTTGFNGNGQLGNGGTSQGNEFQQIAEGLSFARIGVGSTFGYAIDVSGKLYAWGFNGQGQLGTGTLDMELTPVQVGSLTDWKQVVGAEGIIASNVVLGTHALGLHGSATSICGAGGNYVGQLGLEDAPINTLEFDCSILSAVDGSSDPKVQITILPNPSKGPMTIEVEGLYNTRFEIVSFHGHTLFAAAFSEKIAWNGAIENRTLLPSGFYLVRIIGQNAEGDVYNETRPLVIVR